MICKTNSYARIRFSLNGFSLQKSNVELVRSTKNHAALPIGRTARVAYELDVLRAACSRAANTMVHKRSLDETELEECAQLDDALAEAQRVLKYAVRNVMLSRLNRNSRAK